MNKNLKPGKLKLNISKILRLHLKYFSDIFLANELIVN